MSSGERQNSGRVKLRLIVAWAMVVSAIWLLALFSVGRPPSEHRTPSARASETPAEALSTWDALWYLQIATDGYSTTPPGDMTFAYTPLFPAIARLLGGSGHALIGGILLAQICLLGSVLLLSRYSSRDDPAPLLQQPGIWLLVSPVGFYLSMFYPESLFLFLTLLMAWAYQRERFWLAGALGALAGLTRPTAVTVPALFLWDVVQRWRGRRQWVGAGLCALSPLIGFLAFVAVAGYLLKDPFGYSHVQSRYWKLHWTVPLYPLVRGTGGFLFDLVQGNIRPIDQLVRLLTAWGILGLVALYWRKCNPGHLAYLMVSMLFLHAKEPPISTARQELVLFPAYVLLAQSRLARSRLAPLLAALLLLLQFCLFAWVATWGWLA